VDPLSVVVQCKVCGDAFYIQDCRAGVCVNCEEPDDFDADELGLDPEEEYDA
jgi:hypothetical protein